LEPGQSADYLESGLWAHKAIGEARRHAPVNVVASGAAGGFKALPPVARWRCNPHAGYYHITSNETGNGLQMQDFPELPVPLVADMTSDFLTRPIPVERFGLIYASAQKNLGVAGLCLVIVREDLLRPPRRGLPSAFSYQVQAMQQSRFNTPPTFALYVAGLMLRWIIRQDGLTVMAARAREKSRRLYECLDSHDFYRCPQVAADRSTINVCFQLENPGLLDDFFHQAARNGLHDLQGHSAVGGVRASLYNAVEMTAVERLVRFMNDFAHHHGWNHGAAYAAQPAAATPCTGPGPVRESHSGFRGTRPAGKGDGAGVSLPAGHRRRFRSLRPPWPPCLGAGLWFQRDRQPRSGRHDTTATACQRVGPAGHQSQPGRQTFDGGARGHVQVGLETGGLPGRQPDRTDQRTLDAADGAATPAPVARGAAARNTHLESVRHTQGATGCQAAQPAAAASAGTGRTAAG